MPKNALDQAHWGGGLGVFTVWQDRKGEHLFQLHQRVVTCNLEGGMGVLKFNFFIKPSPQSSIFHVVFED